MTNIWNSKDDKYLKLNLNTKLMVDIYLVVLLNQLDPKKGWWPQWEWVSPFKIVRNYISQMIHPEIVRKCVSKWSLCVGFTSKGSIHPQCTFSPLFLWIRPTWASRTGISIFSIFGKPPLDWLSRSGISPFSIFSHQSICMPSTPLLTPWWDIFLLHTLHWGVFSA